MKGTAMLLYNLWIASKSLRRTPWLSVLIVAVIGLGIAVSTSFITIYHVLAQDPIPHRSDLIHYVRMDSWDPQRSYPGDVPQPPTQITYQDMRNIMRSEIPARQTGTFRSVMFVHPDPKVGRPYQANVRMVFADFFAMFDVPFQYGGGWDRSADERPEAVAVIDQETNRKLFGGRDSVGQTIRMEDREFKVAGVLARWRPVLRMYDLTQSAVQAPEPIFIPFNWVEPMELNTSGNSDGWKPSPEPTFRGFLASEQCWIQMWVELPDAQRRRAYEDFLQAYVMDQKKAGRFGRPLDNRVTPVMELAAEFGVVPEQTEALAWISVLFLGVCALNLIGLLLGKFLARAPEVGVRRALGASRLTVFVQHVVECEVIGVAGGVLGLLLSLLVLRAFNSVFPFGAVFHLDAAMVSAAAFLSLAAGLIAGIYPAWRICSIPPAAHLKLQ